MNRRFVRTLLVLAALAVMGLPLSLQLSLQIGPSAAWAARGGVAVQVDSLFFAHPLKTVAVLDMITPTLEDERVMKMQDMVEGALQEKGNFTILYPSDLKAAAEGAGAKDAYELLLKVWRQRRVMDPPAMQKLAAAVNLDALVGIEVTHWEQYQLDLTTEGNSTTTVGLKVSVYSPKDKVLLWRASEVYVNKSPPYNPSGSTVADAGGEERQAGRGGAPKPPEYVPTAQRVVKDVFATWPKKSGGKPDGKGDN